jgi:hypothetical protein
MTHDPADLINRVYLLEQQVTELKRRQTTLEESGRITPRNVLPHRLQLARIAALAAADQGVRVEQLRRPEREQAAVRARALFCHLARARTGAEAPVLAAWLGCAPRCVYHGLNLVRDGVQCRADGVTSALRRLGPRVEAAL